MSGHSCLTYCIELTTPVILFYKLGRAVSQTGVKGSKLKRSKNSSAVSFFFLLFAPHASTHLMVILCFTFSIYITC